MESRKKSAIKVGLITASSVSLAYALIILIVALNTNNAVFYALTGVPPIFVLSFFLGFTMKLGMLKFVHPDSVYGAYDNPIDNYFLSPFRKRLGSIVLTAVCFIPTLLFYFFSSWIFYIVKRKSRNSNQVNIHP